MFFCEFDGEIPNLLAKFTNMKKFISLSAIAFIFASCSRNDSSIAVTKLNDIVQFVDSVEQFNKVYHTTIDTTIVENPIDPNNPQIIRLDTVITEPSPAKSVFGSLSPFGAALVLSYTEKLTVVDSIAKLNAYSEEQKKQLDASKKKFDAMVVEGMTKN